MDETLVVRADARSVLAALRDVAGLAVADGEGPVRVHCAGRYAAVEGLGADTCRAVAEALDVDAAIVGMLEVTDEDDEIDAWTRNAGSVWQAAGTHALEVVDDWLDGAPRHRFADWQPLAEAVLGSALIGDAVEFSETEVRHLRFVGSTSAQVDAAIARIAAGEPWVAIEVDGHPAISLQGERVFVGVEDRQRARDATPKPPERDRSVLTVSLDPPGRFAIDEPSGPLAWGRHASAGDRVVFDVRSRLDPAEVADLILSLIVEAHRGAFPAVSEVVVRQGASEIAQPIRR
jgi:hypothetical protein